MRDIIYDSPFVPKRYRGGTEVRAQGSDGLIEKDIIVRYIDLV